MYEQCMDLQLFYRDTEQADTWMAKQEAFLDTQDYGDSLDPENPRDVIIDFLAANSTWRDNDHNIESQQRVRHERYEKAAYLISTAPQSMIQR